jgi:hypothetical protein
MWCLSNIWISRNPQLLRSCCATYHKSFRQRLSGNSTEDAFCAPPKTCPETILGIETREKRVCRINYLRIVEKRGFWAGRDLVARRPTSSNSRDAGGGIGAELMRRCDQPFEGIRMEKRRGRKVEIRETRVTDSRPIFGSQRCENRPQRCQRIISSVM